MKRGVIDRFEGNFAIIEINGKMQEFSRTELPEGAKEGDAVVIEGGIISIDKAATTELAKKIQALMDDVFIS